MHCQRLTLNLDLQPNWRGVLLARILIQLVEVKLVSAHMMCGCLRMAFGRPAVPQSVADFHAASAFAAGIRIWAAAKAAETKQPLEKILIKVMETCTVALPALLPKVPCHRLACMHATAKSARPMAVYCAV